MKKRVVQRALFLLIAIWGSVNADDTDVYIQATAPSGSEPLVMLSLDFRQNLSGPGCNATECATLIAGGHLSGKAISDYTKFDVLRGVLKKVIGAQTGIKVGVMMSHDDTNNCAVPGPVGPAQAACSNGGFIPIGFGSVDDSAFITDFYAKLDNLSTPTNSGSAHWTQLRETYFELFRYLTGQGVVNAHNSGDDTTGPAPSIGTGVLTSDPSIQGSLTGDYISPFVSNCQKAYAINFNYTQLNNDSDSDALISSSLAHGGMNIDASGNNTSKVTKLVSYLYNNDLGDGRFGGVSTLEGIQNVTSYFFVPTNGKNKGNIWAAAGGSVASFNLDASPDDLISDLQEIFRQIISVSTTFVATSVPVNVFNRAEVVDNLYFAMFQPEAAGKPAWVGNVKKLKLHGLGTNTVTIHDALGQQAVASDGRIRFDALTHWTDVSDLPTADTDQNEVTGRDGRSVDRGAAGQQLPGFVSGGPRAVNNIVGGRTLFFDDTSGDLQPLDASSTRATELASDLGAADATEALELLKYARGMDVDDLNGNGNTSEARDWIMGDILHGRPAPINYGGRGSYSDTNQAIYLAVTSNDGYLRLIRNTTTASGESGEEVWAFMPRSVMGKLKTLRANIPGVAHPYTTDGASVSYIDDLNNNGTVDSGESVWLYFGLRRGGKAYYALDVSDPHNPSLMWKIDKTGDFSELGMTFSTPRIGMVDTGSGAIPALFFAGGYDTNKDDRTTVGTDDAEGNAIYVVNAETGALIWKAIKGTGADTSTVVQNADMDDSIPSTLTVLDANSDGLVDRIVVGDSGGRVWRADLNGTNTNNWDISLLASVGRHVTGASGKADDRRFFHRPDVVQHLDDTGAYDAVIVGTGDRADPLDGAGVTDNYFFVIKDRNISVGGGANTGFTNTSFGDVTDNCLQTGGTCTANLTNGWRLALEALGEKNLSTPVTIRGSIFMTTYVPPPPTPPPGCAAGEGSGHLYALAISNGTAVKKNWDTLGDDQNATTGDRYTILSSGGIPAEPVVIPPDKLLRPDLKIENIGLSTRFRTFWSDSENPDS